MYFAFEAGKRPEAWAGLWRALGFFYTSAACAARKIFLRELGT
jgi:hypothetical protein